jgi:uncharacterized protein YeaO (DUF488 family)
MTVALKRVYRKPSRTDGKRVLVDRLWPRGLTKEGAAVDSWLRNLAPSNELRNWYHAQPDEWETFRKRYLKELSENDARLALDELYKLARSGKITLLFASRNEERNNAVVLRDLLGGARKPPTGTGPAAAGVVRERRAARAPRN